MIGQVVTGRGNARSVIERPRNMAFSQALAASIKQYMGLAGGVLVKPDFPVESTYRPFKQRRAKRVSVTH